jgi:hypothetical protein
MGHDGMDHGGMDHGDGQCVTNVRFVYRFLPFRSGGANELIDAVYMVIQKRLHYLS